MRDREFYVSGQFLAFLAEHFPNRLPPFPTDPALLAYLQGQQSVIQFIERLAEEDAGVPHSESDRHGV